MLNTLFGIGSHGITIVWLLTHGRLYLVFHYLYRMAKFAKNQVEEINGIIEQIEKEIKPNCEIGAREKNLLRSILKTNKIERTVKFFPCKREYSDAIVTHFVTEKGLPKNKFGSNTQAFVYLMY